MPTEQDEVWVRVFAASVIYAMANLTECTAAHSFIFSAIYAMAN